MVIAQLNSLDMRQGVQLFMASLKFLPMNNLSNDSFCHFNE